MKMNFIAAWTAVVFLPAMLAAAEADWYPYTVPTDDTSTAVTHIGALLGEAPAGKHGRLAVGNGHFYFADGTRARFWGVNICGKGNFQEHPVSEQLAARLEKLGVNLARVHIIDTPSPGGLLDISAGDRHTLSDAQFDKLDYFLYQLKQRGIYVNINLHVSREFTELDGVIDAATLPDQSKAVTLFDDTLIELQKDYAQKVFSHFNPYTGLYYTDDPAIAFVEINNENNLLNEWKIGRLFGKPTSDGTLSPYYVNELNVKWNLWLAVKYGTTAALSNAWQQGATSGEAYNKLINPGFEEPLGTGWATSVLAPASAQFTIDTVEKTDGESSVRIVVSSNSIENWRVKLLQRGLVTEKDREYAVRFKAKADSPHQITTVFTQNSIPNTNYGLNKSTIVYDTWRQYEYYFVANTTTSASPLDATYARFGFYVSKSTGTLWLDDVEFSSAQVYGLMPGESIEQMNVERTTWTERGRFSQMRIRDNTEFYAELEKNYYSAMTGYLRYILGVKALITTTSQFAGEPNLLSRSDGDYMDQHIYWDHPTWLADDQDKTSFAQDNESLISDGSTAFDTVISRGALLAANNKPMVVSEFNHCFPNDYEYEMMPVMAAYALLQDWDGLIVHTYQGNLVTGIDYINDNFDIKRNPGKSVQMYLCSLLFRRGYVRPAQRQLTADYSREDVLMNYPRMTAFGRTFMVQCSSIPAQACLQYRLRKNINMPRSSAIDEVLSESERSMLLSAPVIASDTGELRWNREQSGGEYVTFDTPNFQGADGFIAGKTISLSRLTLALNTDCAAYMVSLSTAPIGATGGALLALVGRQENTGQVKDENNGLSDWGGAPVLVEPVKGKISITVDHSPYNCKVYALDEYGRRKSTATVSAADKTISFDAGNDTALWYEIVVPPDVIAPMSPRKFKNLLK
ncbi:MAG: hypothetical protein A2219_05745 [Elusimicrobia bacterium RIFOXYA2_FULL_50_26]|nr:MAG: hypothetical protein A2219_05745 [Elusimicrobia bacterium RIFOXYA2_FULL_50_26]OGS23567.1 MAG: hypothetical protein A2314_03165 [Elusimicrobia bacterium RIFOXYB2_FULL_50_12]